MSKGFSHYFLPTHDANRRWLTGPHGELLLHMPESLIGKLQHPPCVSRIGHEDGFTIDWSDAVHGEEWTKCYIGSAKDNSLNDVAAVL